MSRYLIPPTPPEDLPPLLPTAEDFNIPDEAFGARTAFGALEPGEQLDPDYWDEANRANSTRAAELQNQFLDRQREILHTGPDAYLSKTGRDAVLVAPDVLAQLEAARQETISEAANDVQRRLLRTALGEHRIAEHYRVGTHAGEQSLEWQKQTATERLNQLRQQAAVDYSDPGSIEAYARASESAARERARTMKLGKDSDEAQAEVDTAHSSVWRSAIEAALDKMHTTPAIALFEQAADRLSSQDMTALAPQIDAAREHEAGQAYLATVPIPDARDLGELDAAHQAATLQNQADWPENDTQRAANQYLIDVAFGQRRQGAAQAKADLEQSVKDWLDRPGESHRPSLAMWSRLDPMQQQAVDLRLAQNAIRQPSDPATISDADGEALGGGEQIAQAPDDKSDKNDPFYKLKKIEGAATPEERAKHGDAPLPVMPRPPIALPLRPPSPPARLPEGPPASSYVGSQRAPFEPPASTPPRNPPMEFNGNKYSGHAVDQMQDQGLTPSVIDQAIRTGTPAPGKYPGTEHIYDSANNVSVFRDATTRTIITVRPGR